MAEYFCTYYHHSLAAPPRAYPLILANLDHTIKKGQLVCAFVISLLPNKVSHGKSCMDKTISGKAKTASAILKVLALYCMCHYVVE